MTDIINAAHAHHTRVVLTIEVFAWTSSQAATQGALLGSSGARLNLARQIAQAVHDRGTDGTPLTHVVRINGGRVVDVVNFKAEIISITEGEGARWALTRNPRAISVGTIPDDTGVTSLQLATCRTLAALVEANMARDKNTGAYELCEQRDHFLGFTDIRPDIEAMRKRGVDPDIVDALKGEFKTSMGLDRVRSLLGVASGFDLGNIKQIVLYVPTYTSYDHGSAYGGQSVIVPHWNQILPVVKANFP